MPIVAQSYIVLNDAAPDRTRLDIVSNKSPQDTTFKDIELFYQRRKFSIMEFVRLQ